LEKVRTLALEARKTALPRSRLAEGCDYLLKRWKEPLALCNTATDFPAKRVAELAPLASVADIRRDVTTALPT